MGVSSNFGVIAAERDAPFFETDNYSFGKLNANDLLQPPMGNIIYTAFFVLRRNG